MAFDIAIRTVDFSGNEDRTWTLTRKGYDTCRSVTLDVSTFAATHLLSKGAIPSGTALAKITATGKYGPYTRAGSGGLETCVGLLFNTTKVGTGLETDPSTILDDVAVPMFWEGVVDESQLPAFATGTDGELDAAGKTDLTHIVFE